MKFIVPALIIILSVSNVYFYLQTRHLEQTHELVLDNLQDKLDRAEDECRTKISRVRNHYETQLARKEASSSQLGPGSFLDVLNKIKDKASQTKQEKVLQAKTDLGMDEETFAQFSQVIEQYGANRKQVLELSKSENRLFFDQRYLDMLEDMKQKAMADLKNIVTSDQMQIFQAQELDQALGLKTRADQERTP